MTVTATPVAPNENAVINAQSVTVEVKATSDTGTITGATVAVNNGTALTMTLDNTSQSWKKSVAIPTGACTAKVVITDSTASTATIYINFSRSTSTNPIAAIAITHPTEGQTMRSPGVILQVDVSRTTTITKVEASVDKGVSWVPMTQPVSSGGS